MTAWALMDRHEVNLGFAANDFELERWRLGERPREVGGWIHDAVGIQECALEAGRRMRRGTKRIDMDHSGQAVLRTGKRWMVNDFAARIRPRSFTFHQYRSILSIQLLAQPDH